MNFSSIVRSEYGNLHPNLMGLFVIPNSFTFPPPGDEVSDESIQFRGDPDHDAEIDAKILLAGQFGVPVEDFLGNDNESFGMRFSFLFLLKLILTIFFLVDVADTIEEMRNATTLEDVTGRS